ncbi:bifunctional adenosylcobinamide kinase/adenosylcobinamide-phosphate guanylyltransferase [Paenibacillus albiflavus]|uniref:Adenosylcobinamide kinase n=1 Tax=Paenibacillus albiflavus TaxID=2545760 RepID=A0A4R4E4X2_9BACL|nr:bifunctional adenosylcobinamide kinase/adenosylcobinamide-phosphate guanylyltransferase [Paenibacillus albiflavus]TCZ73770.1 bifunctional adenosylcobinamide kinase/adenosylcobinamide-phosphate guanylyltransferase [Paenibacillus albiflavus]
MAILVTGGARSGKSSFAERLAAKRGTVGLYIATAQIYDEEMRERISLHQQQRSSGTFPWTTREEPYALAGLLRELGSGGEQGNRERSEAGKEAAGAERTVVLVDCLTLWLSNQLLRHEDQPEAEAAVTAMIADLVDAVASYPYPLILVTNEVGDGIVPVTKLGRQFRDLAGRLNQQLASICSQVFLVTAGIPIELRSLAYRLEESELL